MAENPLEVSAEREERIRQRAYLLWEADGCPRGRDQEFWERAESLVRLEESEGAGQLPNQVHERPAQQEGIEEAQIQENYGETPGRLTDQGEWRGTPMTKKQEREWLEGKSQPTRGDTP